MRAAIIAIVFLLTSASASGQEPQRRLFRCTDGKTLSYVSVPVVGATCVGFASQGSGGPALRSGYVYSYVTNGVRHYKSSPPSDGIEFRTIRYQYVQGAPQQQAIKPRAFRGFGCTSDCSGHQAGYDWAEQRGIDHPDECGGRSQSFIEGCQAFAQEAQEEMIESGECEDADADELCD